MTKRARQVGAAVMAIGFVVALGMRSDPDVAVAQRRAPVKATRLFTGPDGQTHAEEIEMKLSPSGTSGELSPTINVNGLQFRRTAPNYFVDWHTAPRRQYVVTLSGKGEIELWKSDEVLHALDLCLSCKGCKKDCPVSVDMATYKAEFLSHYYEGKPRPRVAYAMGLIGRWARIGSHVPGLANFVLQAPGLSGAVKRTAGIAPERAAPRFASRTFRSWFHRRGSWARPGSPPVLLWPDTFVNFFHPQVGKATVEVLERAGYQVELPKRVLCCGRPLYDYGMLDTAGRWLRQILRTLRPQIRNGVTVIGMEPSCLAVFRDEMPNLFPDDEDAKRLARQSVLLSEFLEERGWEPPKLSRQALVQGHCHHRAVMGFDTDQRMLERLGMDFEVLDSGCCGLAGSFGFEAGEKYDVSMKAGERVLFPKVREASPDTLIVADGSSTGPAVGPCTSPR